MSPIKTMTIKKKAEDATPYWKDLVAHLDNTWKKKKGVPFYFRGQYFRELKELARIYTPFGVMALWDLYLSEKDDFVKAAGYSFEMFCAKIPKLLDMNWKGGRERYETEIVGRYPKFVEDLAGEIANKKAGSDAPSEGSSEPAVPEGSLPRFGLGPKT